VGGLGSSLTSLSFYSCYALTLDGFAALAPPRLASLKFRFCDGITSLQGLSGVGLGALTSLEVYSGQLTSLHGFEHAGLSTLRVLRLRCYALSTLQPLDLCNLASVVWLNLNNCSRLPSLAGLGALPVLASLDLRGCTSLRIARRAIPTSVVVRG